MTAKLLRLAMGLLGWIVILCGCSLVVLITFWAWRRVLG